MLGISSALSPTDDLLENYLLKHRVNMAAGYSSNVTERSAYSTTYGKSLAKWTNSYLIAFPPSPSLFCHFSARLHYIGDGLYTLI